MIPTELSIILQTQQLAISQLQFASECEEELVFLVYAFYVMSLLVCYFEATRNTVVCLSNGRKYFSMKPLSPV